MLCSAHQDSVRDVRERIYGKKREHDYSSLPGLLAADELSWRCNQSEKEAL